MLIKFNNHLLKINHRTDSIFSEQFNIKCTDNKKIQYIKVNYYPGFNQCKREIMIIYYKINSDYNYYYYIYAKINSSINLEKIVFHFLDSKIEYKVNLKQYSSFSNCFTKLSKYFDDISKLN